MVGGLIRLMRLQYSLTLAGGLVVILLYARAGEMEGLWRRAAMAAAMACVIAGGQVYNDVCDVASDRVNHPRRPLPAGRVPVRAASRFAGLLFIAGLALSQTVTFTFFVGEFAVVAGLIVYDRHSKRMGILRDLLAAGLAVSLYPLALAVAEPIASGRLASLWIFAPWFFLTALAYEMFKNIRDVQGDAPAAGRSLPNWSGRAWFGTAARILLAVTAGLAMLPWALGYCRWVYGVASLGAAGLAVIAVRSGPVGAIRLIYAQVILVTAGSLADLLIFGI